MWVGFADSLVITDSIVTTDSTGITASTVKHSSRRLSIDDNDDSAGKDELGCGPFFSPCGYHSLFLSPNYSEEN